MKIHKHNVAMQWITRRRTNEVAGLYESFPGTFSAYQEALSSGFQGTMEEFIQHQSIPQSDRPFTGKIGGLVEPGVTHYAKSTPLYQQTTEYKKRQEAAEKGMVYDKETDTIRADIRKRRLVLKTIVPLDRYKEIKLANPGMSEIELQKAYEKLTRNQQDGLVYTKRGVYPNRSGVINPSPAKLQELRHASKLPKSFKIIQDAKIKNTQTNKLWTFEEWKNATQSRRTYHLGLAQDYEGFRAKQKKYMQITQERAGPKGYKSVPGAFRGETN